MQYESDVTRSFETVRQMLVDRGVAFEDSIGSADVLEIAGSRNDFHVDIPGTAPPVRVIYYLNSSFKLAEVKKRIESAETFVVVVRSMPTTAALKGVEELKRDVQFFDVRQLLFNVSRHRLVPRHEPIRDEADIQKVVERYALRSRYLLPLIHSTDPMARYLALKPGQLVRITRPSPSAGEYVLYRCCQKA